MAELKKVGDDLRATLDQMKADAKPEVDPADAWNDAFIKRKMKRQAELEAMLEKGEYIPKAKGNVFELSQAAKDAKEATARAQDKVDNMVEAKRVANLPIDMKTYNVIARVGRAAKMLSYSVFEHLGSAALAKYATTPMDAMMGSVLRLIPGLDKVYDGAERNGSGFRLKDEKAAWAELANPEAYKDYAKIWKTGASQSETLFGKGHETGPLTFETGIYRSHQIFKNMTKRSEEARSNSILMDWNQEHGVDLSNPETISQINTKAFNESKASVLMGDNAGMDTFKRTLSSMENSDHAGVRAVAGAIKMAFPIVKMALNFADEVTAYTAGLAKASPGIWKAISKGA